MDLVKFRTIQMAYKARHQLLPVNIQRWFRDRDDHYNLRRRQNFRQQMAHGTLKSMCVSVRGVKMWNDLPESMQEIKFPARFKKQLKIYLIEEYNEIRY